MRRYIGASLILGSLVSLLVLVFYEVEVFADVAAGLARVYADAFGSPSPQPAPSGRLLQYAAVIVAGIGLSWTSMEIPRWNRRVLVAGMALLVLALLSVGFALRGVLFEPVSGGIAVLASLVAGGAFASSGPGPGRRGLVDLMANRLSGREFARLLSAPARLPLEGEHREATVVVCRRLNDGELRASLEARDVVRMVNLFLRCVPEVLVREGGFVESVGPEGVRAYFGAPSRDSLHAARACQAALALSRRLADLARECDNRWQQHPDFGIAVVTGTLTMARFRHPGGGRYAGLGWETDFARRLCGANARLGSTILIDAPTYAAVSQDFAVRPLDLLDDADSAATHEAFELLGRVDGETEPARLAREAFGRAVAHFRAGRHVEALEAFDHARADDGDDRPLALCIERARQGARATDDAQPERTPAV